MQKSGTRRVGGGMTNKEVRHGHAIGSTGKKGVAWLCCLARVRLYQFSKNFLGYRICGIIMPSGTARPCQSSVYGMWRFWLSFVGVFGLYSD